MAFAPDGQVLAILWENNAMLVDVQSRKRLHLLEGHQNTVKCVALSPDGRSLVTGSHDRTIRIWDIRTGKTRHVIAAHRDKISALAVAPDGRTIASGDHQGTIAFSHLETGQFLFDTKLSVQVIARVAFSRDAETLAVALGGERIVLLHAPPLATRAEGPSATDEATVSTNSTVKRNQKNVARSAGAPPHNIAAKELAIQTDSNRQRCGEGLREGKTAESRCPTVPRRERLSETRNTRQKTKTPGEAQGTNHVPHRAGHPPSGSFCAPERSLIYLYHSQPAG